METIDTAGGVLRAGGSDYRRHLAWRRLHGARRYRRRPRKPHVSARSVAGPDVLRHLDRGLVRPGVQVEAGVLGRGARADLHARPHGDARPLCAARAPWLADLRAELLSFPAGQHDDQARPDRPSARPDGRRAEAEAAGHDATQWLSRGIRGNDGHQWEDDVRRTMTYAPLFARAEQRPRRGVMAQTSTLDNVPVEGV